jgi:hypothetical protein
MLIAENYKNVHSGHDHGISWEQSHINSYDKSILHLIPNQAVHPACYYRTALQGTGTGQLHDRYTTRIETMFRNQSHLLTN